MYGSGLFKGLGVTFKHWFQREITEQYPEQRPDLPPASQGFFEYELEKCIACSLCERACPNKVITIGIEKNEEGKRVVTSYNMDISYCLYCGLCIEACPTAALRNANNFEMACYHRPGTIYEFTEELPQALNDAFDKTQADYWNKKRPEGNPIGMPKAVPAAGAPAPKAAAPAAKPAEKPVEKAAETEKPVEKAAEDGKGANE